MKTFSIKLGKGRGALSIDAARLVEGRCLIQGASGSGKSYLVRVLVEQTIPAGLQTIILDPEGEFSTLRERCNVLIAGREGDVPTELRSAKLLARRIAETGVSTVVDMSALKLDERRQFVAIFCDTLDALPKKLERPRVVVLDEAHKFCPESGKGKAASTEAVITLMSQGRKRGLCGVLVTQRLSKLKKDAAAEAANVFIGKTSPIDLHSAQDMLGVLREDRESLRSLGPGQFYATGPAISSSDVTVFQARTAKTTHPSPGSRYKMETPPAPAVISKILKEFEALPPAKEVEAAETLKAAKGRIRELERALKKGGDPEEIRELRQALRSVEAERDAAVRRLAAVETNLRRLADDATELADGLGPRPNGAPIARRRATSRPSYSPAKKSEPRREDLGDVPPARQRILDALAWLEAIGLDDADRAQLAFLSSQKPTSGGYKNYLGALRTCGLIDYPSPGRVALTDEGRAVANPQDEPPDSETLQAMVMDRLPPARCRILVPLLEAHPEPIEREELAELSGQKATSGGYKNHLGAMRTLGLLDYPAPGQVRASDVLFLGGEP